MDTKHILMITHDFYPEISPRSFRATELAKEFAREGQEVTVLTKYRDEREYAGLPFRDKMNIKSFGKLRFPEVKISSKKYLHWPSRVARRLLQLLFEYPAIEMMFKVKRALRNESGYDLLISIAVPYPIHWGVAWARTAKHPIAMRWVADCGDPYYGQENDSFRVMRHFKVVEKWFSRKADYLSVPTPSAIDGYFPEFRDKIRIIPQGFQFQDANKGSSFHRTSRPKFAYGGGFIKGRRDPGEFLTYLLNLNEDFEFHIYTSHSEFVDDAAARSGGRIICHDIIPRLQFLSNLSTMDFVVNFENGGAVQTPSKLIDYAIVNKPILSIKTGGLDTENVDRFLRGDYSGQYEVDNLDQYRIENVCKQFLDLI